MDGYLGGVKCRASYENNNRKTPNCWDLHHLQGWSGKLGFSLGQCVSVKPWKTAQKAHLIINFYQNGASHTNTPVYTGPISITNNRNRQLVKKNCMNFQDRNKDPKFSYHSSCSWRFVWLVALNDCTILNCQCIWFFSKIRISFWKYKYFQQQI